jgi:Double zinc ribbon
MTCSNCGHDNPSNRKFCSQCGAGLTPVSSSGGSAEPGNSEAGGAPCKQCGATVPPGRKFCTVCGSAVSATSSTPPSDGSIQASLAKLGIRFSKGEWIGFAVSVTGGFVMARILPYVYPILSPVLDAVFGPGPSNPRDSFNSFMMTGITFATSFIISFIVFKKKRET